MYVEARLPVLIRRYYPHPGYLMGTINWQQHRLRRTFVRSARANHHFTSPDTANQDHMPHRYAFLFGKAFDAVRQLVTMLQTYHENAAQLPFT
jgi:hypothetical protein